MIGPQFMRNFCIIAHIDHGKSTFADRLLEITKTVDARKMRSQYLDTMDLERERGITIKMQPVRMSLVHRGVPYILNLIDTPGHIDFNYEVSRALLAVEGAILLVDATQGVQAQTMANLELARNQNLTIVPVINKIDLAEARIEETIDEMIALLGCQREDIVLVSAKTGGGVYKVFDAIIEKIPPPGSVAQIHSDFQALVFDSQYSPHKGVLAFVRVFAGAISPKDRVKFVHAKTFFEPMEVGVFMPQLQTKENLSVGEIGYVATNIKDPGMVRVGDTIGGPVVEGYEEPRPMIWASIFTEAADDFENLKDAFSKLHLNDASLSFEVEGSDVAKRALRVGFLGMLHLEITTERISREFGIDVVVSSPSVEYLVEFHAGEKQEIRSPKQFADIKQKVNKVFERWFAVSLLSRTDDLGAMMDLIQKNEGAVGNTKTIGGNRILVEAEVPLRKLVADFFDDLKSVTQGYGSMSYAFAEWRPVDLVELRVMLAGKEMPQFAKLIPRHDAEYEARRTVKKLYDLLPRQLFATKIQGACDGRILASLTLSASGKNVTAKLYGGDRTRKMKLWKKQKEGKKRLLEHADVMIPQEVYLKMIRK